MPSKGWTKNADGTFVPPSEEAEKKAKSPRLVFQPAPPGVSPTIAVLDTDIAMGVAAGLPPTPTEAALDMSSSVTRGDMIGMFENMMARLQSTAQAAEASRARELAIQLDQKLKPVTEGLSEVKSQVAEVERKQSDTDRRLEQLEKRMAEGAVGGGDGSRSSASESSAGRMSRTGRWYPAMEQRTTVIMGGWQHNTPAEMIKSEMKAIALVRGCVETEFVASVPYETASKGFLEFTSSARAWRLVQSCRGRQTSSTGAMVWIAIDRSPEEQMKSAELRTMVKVLRQLIPNAKAQVSMTTGVLKIGKKTVALLEVGEDEEPRWEWKDEEALRLAGTTSSEVQKELDAVKY